MVEDFLKEYVEFIVDYPERIDTQRVEMEENFVGIFLSTDKDDTGELIGKDGKMINVIKTVIPACKSKENISYRVTVKALE